LLKRSRYEIICDILKSAEADWLSITDLADRTRITYWRAAVEARRLLERGLMASRREGRLTLYRTTLEGKRVADRIRQVLAYLR